MNLKEFQQRHDLLGTSARDLTNIIGKVEENFRTRPYISIMGTAIRLNSDAQKELVALLTKQRDYFESKREESAETLKAVDQLIKGATHDIHLPYGG